MSQTQDLRSTQRFQNFTKALTLYSDAAASPSLSRLEQEGLIQRFEYTFELAWKYLQDLLQERGYVNVRGPRPVIEQAFQDGLISNAPVWLAMLKSRNEMTHLYDEATFNTVSHQVRTEFLIALKKLHEDFKQ